MDENAIRTILAILNRKNDVEIKRTGDGYVIIPDFLSSVVENGAKPSFRSGGSAFFLFVLLTKNRS